MTDDLGTLKRRLAAGEWLLVGDVTALLREYAPTLHRATVDRWVRAGRSPNGTPIRYRKPGGQRQIRPDDVRALLAEAQREYSGDQLDG